MIQPPRPHPLVRLANHLGPALSGACCRQTFDEDRFRATAAARAGCDDFGPKDYAEGLSVLCDSARREANLTYAGALGLTDEIINALVTRLLRMRARQQGTLPGSGPLNRPLLVVGLPRSGTTYLHRLLSLDPVAKALRTWEVREPIAPPGRDRRRFRTRMKVAGLKLAAPGIDAKHRVDVDQPEECMYLLDSSLRSDAFGVMAPVHSYLDWLRDQDMQPAYEAYRELLTLFQRAAPERRLTLKAPSHTANIPTMMTEVPELLLVQTHRDPVPIVNSVNSLLLSLQGAMCRPLDVGRMAQANLATMALMAQRSLEARAQLPELPLVDVSYDDLVRDPLAQVRKIYAYHDLPFTEVFEQRLREAVAVRKQHRFGRHHYAAADFELTDGEIAERFGAYRARFLA